MLAFKYRKLAILICAVVVHPSLAIATVSKVRTKKGTPGPEVKLWRRFEIESKFVPIPHSTSTEACESTTLPEPLTTPLPLIDIDAASINRGFVVSFVIGTDGSVHGALLLKSVSNNDDRAVLTVVRSWRYRPALCNGVPAEAEATVDFSSRRRSFGLE